MNTQLIHADTSNFAEIVIERRRFGIHGGKVETLVVFHFRSFRQTPLPDIEPIAIKMVLAGNCQQATV